MFKYLRPVLDQSDYKSPEVLCKVRKVRQVWKRLVKLLNREGPYPSFLEKFYHTLLQLVLFFEADMWALLAKCKYKQFYIPHFHAGNTRIYP